MSDIYDDHMAYVEADHYGRGLQPDLFSSFPVPETTRFHREPKTCNRCGETGLQWGKVVAKDKAFTWRLFDCYRQLHVCEPPPPTRGRTR